MAEFDKVQLKKRSFIGGGTTFNEIFYVLHSKKTEEKE
jgi:hypothetical protein